MVKLNLNKDVTRSQLIEHGKIITGFVEQARKLNDSIKEYEARKDSLFETPEKDRDSMIMGINDLQEGLTLIEMAIGKFELREGTKPK